MLANEDVPAILGVQCLFNVLYRHNDVLYGFGL